MDSVIIKTQVEHSSVHVSDYDTGVHLSIFVRSGYASAYLDYGQAVELSAALGKFLAAQYQKAREGTDAEETI